MRTTIPDAQVAVEVALSTSAASHAEHLCDRCGAVGRCVTLAT